MTDRHPDFLRDPRRPRSLQHLVAHLVLWSGIALAAFLIFNNLGEGSIDLWDESLTAGRSLYVFEHRSLFNIQVNGELSIRKPPLMYTLNAAAFRMFGVNLFSLRLSNAVFGLVSFLLLAWLVHHLLGLRYAALTPWLLLGSYRFIAISREALTDTVFITAFLLMTLAIMHLLSGSRSRALSHALFALSVVLVLLGKGPVGFFLVFYSIAFLMLFRPDYWREYTLTAIASSLPFLIWLAGQWLQNAEIGTILSQEYLQRLNYRSDFLPAMIQEPSWYLSDFWRSHRLTGLLGLLSMVAVLWSYTVGRKAEISATYLQLLYIAGLAACYLALISLVAHKHNRYAIPLIPLLIPLLLTHLKTLWESKGWLLPRLGSLLLVLCIVTGAYAVRSKYLAVPDYEPRASALADAIRSQVWEDDLQPYTDTCDRALLLHFYLQRKVGCNRAIEQLPARSVFIAPGNSPNRPLVIEVTPGGEDDRRH